MALLPKSVIDKWKKIKSDLLPAIAKMQGPTINDATRRELARKVTDLYDQFDSGLRDSLKKASEAKTDKDAVLALGKAIKTSNDYLAKAKTARSAWGTVGTGMADIIIKGLENIKDSCEKTLEAIAAK